MVQLTESIIRGKTRMDKLEEVKNCESRASAGPGPCVELGCANSRYVLGSVRIQQEEHAGAVGACMLPALAPMHACTCTRSTLA